MKITCTKKEKALFINFVADALINKSIAEKHEDFASLEVDWEIVEEKQE